MMGLAGVLREKLAEAFGIATDQVSSDVLFEKEHQVESNAGAPDRGRQNGAGGYVTQGSFRHFTPVSVSQSRSERVHRLAKTRLS